MPALPPAAPRRDRRTAPRRAPRRTVRGVVTLLASAALFTSLFVAAAATASAADTSQLAAGSTLTEGNRLTSANGTYALVMQGDGNLVLYNAKGALWSSRSFTAHSHLTMQTDGNLVIYSSTNQAVWNTHTAGSGAQNKLVMQDDGDVVLFDGSGAMQWHSDTAIIPPPVSVGSSVPFGVALTPSRFLTSKSGAITAKFDDTGSFIVRISSRVLWSASAGFQPGQRFLLQGDGNVVLYGSTTALWNSRTSSKTPGKLVMQDDGNLVAYTTTGTAIWSSRSFLPKTPDAGSDRLLGGQQLVPGSSITAKGGAYKLVQQGDGNLVVYGPSGATWTTNTSGWSGVYSVLQSDGNFVTYGPVGQALWNARSFGSTALVMQGDGNLVAYTAAGKAVWSSRYSAKPPPLFPPVTSPPPTAVSRYLRNLDGTGADVTFMRSAGCSDARGVPNGKRYLAFLAFGAQTSNVKGSWGVNLTASTGLISNGAVVAAVDAYIDGYRGCMQPYSALTVAVGTNNDGEDAGLGSAGGKIWADQVVDPIAAYAAPGGRVTVAAANDIEPGFAGTPAQAISWMQGYLANSNAPFVNTGSADGCPQTLGTTTSCNYGWTPKNLYDLTYGMMPTRALPLVQIYYTSMARQWANISLVGGNATGKRMSFAGPLTEVTACQQADSCYSMSSTDAWNTLWNQLKADPRTAISDLPYLTDLRIDR